MVSPLASMVSLEVYLVIISDVEPTAINFPSLIANASASLKASFTVYMVALVTIKSTCCCLQEEKNRSKLRE